MINKRSALALLAGAAVLPFAVEKLRGLVDSSPIYTPLLQLHNSPAPIPVVKFSEESGQNRSLANFFGKHVLVNIWSTLCPPCRKEMPPLDRLQDKLGPISDIQIVALSLDTIGFDQLRAFYSEIGVHNLAIYKGDEAEVMQSLRIVGLPTSLFIDHQCREIGRLIGPTIWDSPVVTDQISKLTVSAPIAQPTG